MPFARAVDSVATNPVWFRVRPEVFDVNVAASARLPAGVLGFTVLVRHDARRFRFALNGSPSANTSKDDVATALAGAVERAFAHEDAAAVVEEILVIFRSGSIPIACEGVTSKTLLPLLRGVVDSIVTPDRRFAGTPLFRDRKLSRS